jgi:hypothetical protein
MVERLLGRQEVRGSIPLRSTEILSFTETLPFAVSAKFIVTIDCSPRQAVLTASSSDSAIVRRPSGRSRARFRVGESGQQQGMDEVKENPPLQPEGPLPGYEGLEHVVRRVVREELAPLVSELHAMSKLLERDQTRP